MKLWRKAVQIWKDDLGFQSMWLGGLVGGLFVFGVTSVIMGHVSYASLCGVGIGLIFVVGVYTGVKLYVTRKDDK